jgi:ribosomal protein S18 acetylase RimI-like enzyme
MTDQPFEIRLLGKEDRSRFCCGSEPLDRYLKTQVGQDMRRRVSACYVAVEKTTGRVAGYYTLSAADVPIVDLPADITRGLPRYPSVPTARIGRLAIDRDFQGRGLGAALLLNAAMRALRSEIAVYALVVDAKGDEAAAFYRHHGFSAFASNPLQLVAPIETFRRLLR